MTERARSGSSSANNPRRSFLKAFAIGTGGLTALWGRKLIRGESLPESAAQAALPTAPGNQLVRMQQEMHSALARPMAARRWTMVVDPRKCVGCQACVVACRAENVTGPEGSYRRVPEAPAGRYPEMTNVFMPANCVQCDDPPCARVAPAGAVHKRPDGIVEFDYGKLKGAQARAVAESCPYRAVHVDDGKLFTQGTPSVQPYESRRFAEYQGTWNRQDGSVKGAARKCHFCLHRVEAGTLPACVTTCIGGAMYFGDLGDSNSMVSELLRQNRTIRIHEELGIEPRVYYVEEKIPNVRQFSCATCH